MDIPSGGVTAGTDCDDGDATINPDAEEIIGDMIDNNCDGKVCFISSLRY